MILPIFIHIHEKTEKEIREEMEENRKWREAIKRDNEIQLARERERKEEERRLREEIKRKLDDEYYNNKNKNPWEYSILPEGWSIFGTPLKIVEEL